MSEQHLSDTSFTDLPLAKELLQAIADQGFTRCTPIQAMALPLALSGRDVVGQAQTGTGKTAAFLLATMQHLLSRPPAEATVQPRALILAPTRELAVQIHKDALALGKYTGLRFGLAYGGTGYEAQRNEIAAGVDVLIGTPGRLIDYFKQHVYNLKGIQVVVLDEADRMFDLGFIKDIRFVLRRMPSPEQRLSMLFSATLALRVTELGYEHMNNPKQVSIEPKQVTAKQVREAIYYPANSEKIPLLVGLLRQLTPERAMIFVNTKRAAETLESYLAANGFNVGLLSGDVPQKKRLRLLASFQDGSLPILVATDVAARGLHIAGVSHVFNFDLPQDAEDYVHRIGRTARAGASGEAISFACEDYSVHLLDIEEYIGHKIPSERVNSELLPVLQRPGRRPPREQEGGRGAEGRRRSPRAGRSRPKRPGEQRQPS